MIDIRIVKDSGGIVEFKFLGHANADEYGKDIVCAGVSVLCQTSVLALCELLDIDVKYEIKDGYLFCRLPSNLEKSLRKDANIILNTMTLGIENLQRMYSNYININIDFEEV